MPTHACQPHGNYHPLSKHPLLPSVRQSLVIHLSFHLRRSMALLRQVAFFYKTCKNLALSGTGHINKLLHCDWASSNNRKGEYPLVRFFYLPFSHQNTFLLQRAWWALLRRSLPLLLVLLHCLLNAELTLGYLRLPISAHSDTAAKAEIHDHNEYAICEQQHCSQPVTLEDQIHAVHRKTRDF